MANGLYTPEDCESERTVIISELQGGENDPEQLLDTEVTAAAFKAHPYRHPTIGWLTDLRDDDARRPLRPLPPLLRPEQRDPGGRRRRREPTTCSGGSEAHFGGDPGRDAARRACARSEPAADWRTPGAHRARKGTTAYLKLAYHAPAGDRCRLLPAAGPRRGAHRREGREPLVVVPQPAAAERPPVSRARGPAARLVGLRRAAADRGPVPLHRLDHGDRRGAARGRRRGGAGASWTRPRARASRRRSSTSASTSCAHGSCSRPTA